MPLPDHEWLTLQLLLKKATEKQQLGEALASQGLQMPVLPSRPMGAMTDASKRRMDDMSSLAGDEFEFVSEIPSSSGGQNGLQTMVNMAQRTMVTASTGTAVVGVPEALCRGSASYAVPER